MQQGSEVRYVEVRCVEMRYVETDFQNTHIMGQKSTGSL